MSDHKKAAPGEENWPSNQEKYEGKPHGWIQWKGTNVCMDIHCSCGHHSHVDAEFAYYVECPKCHKKWFMNGHVEMIEVETVSGCLVQPPLEED